MAQVVTERELRHSLDQDTARWSREGYQVGLYSVDVPITPETVLADLTPCSWGGYDGLRSITGWTTAEWDGARASVAADPVVWTHDGTGSAQDVAGHYVLDGSGELAWIGRRDGGVVSMGALGQVYSVTPRYTRRSEASEG